MAALLEAVDLQALLLVVVLVGAVLVVGYLAAEGRFAKRKKASMQLQYEVADKTTTACLDLLQDAAAEDMFLYKMERAARGNGWYIHFTLHEPTGQPLDTLFRLEFTGEEPARFTLGFVREAFGMREPVLPEDLLDAFFAAKLGAKRAGVPEPPAQT